MRKIDKGIETHANELLAWVSEYAQYMQKWISIGMFSKMHSSYCLQWLWLCVQQNEFISYIVDLIVVFSNEVIVLMDLSHLKD